MDVAAQLLSYNSFLCFGLTDCVSSNVSTVSGSDFYVEVHTKGLCNLLFTYFYSMTEFTDRSSSIEMN